MALLSLREIKHFPLSREKFVRIITPVGYSVDFRLFSEKLSNYSLYHKRH